MRRQDLKTVYIREHHVQKGDADVLVLLEQLERFLARGGLQRVVARAAQVDDHEAADGVFVLKDQYFSSQAPHLPVKLLSLLRRRNGGASRYYITAFSLMVAEDNKI